MINNIDSTVISTRIRLARNIEGYNFPNKLSVSDAQTVIRLVDNAASEIGSYKLYRMEEIGREVALSLRDDHLISEALVRRKESGAALIDEGYGYNEQGGKTSVMINEEDHLREQYIVRGLNLHRAYRKLSMLDDRLSASLRFAYDSKLGYLTACPSNLGTGLRASVMMFLPGLTKRKKMQRLIAEVSGLGHTVRGVYGEGSEAEGYMYQVSNEVTLGVDEEYILDEVQKTVLEIVNLEAHARKSLVSDDEVGVKDKSRRALGILSYCERISYTEFLQLASEVKLGVALGFLDIKDITRLDDLISALRDANLDLLADGATANERDELRAEKCRKFIHTQIW